MFHQHTFESDQHSFESSEFIYKGTDKDKRSIAKIIKKWITDLYYDNKSPPRCYSNVSTLPFFNMPTTVTRDAVQQKAHRLATEFNLFCQSNLVPEDTRNSNDSKTLLIAWLDVLHMVFSCRGKNCKDNVHKHDASNIALRYTMQVLKPMQILFA
jgi:hypothetical protein